MKKICIFCETWSSGGIESFLCKLITQMDRTGLQIDLVVAQQMDSVFTKSMQDLGVAIIPLSGSKARWLSNCRAFQKLLRQKQYDVVHLNGFQGLQLVYLHLAKNASVPVRIAHSHGSGLRKSPLRLLKVLLHTIGIRLFGHDATLYWACSSAAGNFLFPKGHPFQVIPNGIDTEQYRFRPSERTRVRASLGLENTFVIGSVGRLQPDKNQAFLLDILAELLPMRPESKLLLVGDGPIHQALQDRAEQLGLSPHVLLYGLSSHVEELLWAMDAFAFPSLSEGLGLVAVEAQAAGLPVIGSEHIPEEANLTPWFRRIPLTKGPRAWAEALLHAETPARACAADLVRQAGFEMAQVAEQVRRHYETTPLDGF